MKYNQEKIEKKTNIISTCELTLNITNNEIIYESRYNKIRNSLKYNDKKINIENSFSLKIDLLNGDFYISYKKYNNKKSIKSSDVISKKNNFKCLEELTSRGFHGGQNRINFWGVKYLREINNIFNNVQKSITNNIENDFFKNKTYDNPVMNNLYDLIVDFYLIKHKIKGHDYVYYDILTYFPLKKWLKLNDNKFLPSILDQYGVKSKYLIKKISMINDTTLGYNLKLLIYICKLFGQNKIDYINKFNVMFYPTYSALKPKTFHYCKTDTEKKCLLNIFQRNINTNDDYYNVNIITLIYNLFDVRNFLELKGYTDLKINVKTEEELDMLLEKWMILKEYNKNKYKLRYNIPIEIKTDIETPIIIDDEIFLIKLLITKDDFILEGNRMKNCMSRQFIHGYSGFFISMTNKKKTINIQYNNNKIIQIYGKANTAVPYDIFGKSISILNERILKYKFTKWEKEKYDIME